MSFYRPLNSRYATQDVIWPAPHGGQPFFIPAGTACVYSVFVMHRRVDLWGPDGNRYILQEAGRAYPTLRTGQP